MTFLVRCRNYKCRHRRTSKMHPDDYKRPPKCRVCGSNSGWRLEEHRPWHKTQACDCGSVVGKNGPFTHNKWHKMCDNHPQGKRNQMLRAGVEPFDLPIEIMGVPQNGECPF